MSRARYLALEGADGAGKTTQLKLLTAAMREAGHDVVTTREPGGTPVADEMRRILLTGSATKLFAESEALLMSASRRQLMGEVIEPALADGKWVVSDRTFLSTLVFQGYGRGLDRAMLETLTDFAIGDCRPVLQLVLDVDPETGLTRKAPQFYAGEMESRMESVGLAFHQRNRAGYLAYVQENPDRMLVIDASAAPADVHAGIIKAVNERLGLTLRVQSASQP